MRTVCALLPVALLLSGGCRNVPEKQENSQMQKPIAEEYMIPMRDGVRLYTQVMAPGSGKYPVVFLRTPYGKKDVTLAETLPGRMDYLQAGYAVIAQHCRGCGRSEGDFIPYMHERQDGLDTLDWIRRQPCYGGELFLQGESYGATAHFAYLDTNPADIRAAILTFQDVNRYNILYRNGFYKCGHGGWFTGHYCRNTMPEKNFNGESFLTLPLSAFARKVFGREVPEFSEEISHPDPEDPYWKTPAGGSEYLHALEPLRIPVLLATSFYDIYTDGVFRMWENLPEANRSRCALVITPYAHGTRDKDCPVTFPDGVLDEVWKDYRINWFNAARGREKLRFVRPGETVWYSQFEGVWRHAPFLQEGKERKILYINAAGLSPEAGPVQERSYTYDPRVPAMFRGGCAHAAGMREQDPPDSREDIASFLTAPFPEKQLIRGAMKVRLFVRSSCPDSCFYIRMSLVRQGKTLGMRDGITAISRQYPDYVPGQEAALDLVMTENAFLLAQGDRIRLDISSSCYPYYVPHTNRKGLFSIQTGADTARNTVLTGKSFLSYCTVSSDDTAKIPETSLDR